MRKDLMIPDIVSMWKIAIQKVRKITSIYLVSAIILYIIACAATYQKINSFYLVQLRDNLEENSVSKLYIND